METSSVRTQESRSCEAFDKVKFLQRHMKLNDDMAYSTSELQKLVTIAKEIFKEEAMLLEVLTPVKVVGDVHGQFKDLLSYFTTIGRSDKNRYLFLGDYVDRGPKQLETICCLLAWKINYPRQFYMLRGNHETRSINRAYGFMDDLIARFGKNEGNDLWEDFNSLFDHMPVAALIRKKILCMHGGFGPTLKSLDQIRKIERPLPEPAKYPVAQDLLWADPVEDVAGFYPNTIRGVSWFYGSDMVRKLCEELKLTMVIRAHQMMNNGYGFFCGRKLITLFSAPGYNEERDNMAAVLTISDDMKMGIRLFNPTIERDDGEREFRNKYHRGPTGYLTRALLEEQNAQGEAVAVNDMTVLC